MTKLAQFFQIKNSTDKKAVINIMGDIGSWWEGNTDRDIAAQLQFLSGVEEIDVYINSYGGLLGHGLSVANQLRRHGAKINTHVDGMAYSAGGVIFMAGDTRNMPKGTTIMVHKAASGAYGFADDLRKAADALDVMTDSLIGFFAERTGLDVGRVAELVNAETFLTPDQALEFGFATSIGGNAVEAMVDDENLVINGLQVPRNQFANMPQSILNSFKPAPKAMPASHNSIAGQAGNQTTKELHQMDLETLNTKHPEIVKAVKAEAVNSAREQIKSEAVNAERERITAINGAVLPAFAALAEEAINSGMSAGDFALKQAQAMKNQDKDGAKNHIESREKASQAMNGIKPAANKGVDGGEEEAAEEAAFLSAATNAYTGAKAN